MQPRHIPCIALALLAAADLMPPHAWAHAFLDHAEPRVGSTVAKPPDAVTLTFSEPVEADFSRIEILDARDQRIATEPLTHPKPAELQVPLPPLPPGEYTVHWAVTSIDTHQTEGRFAFTIAAP
jgi:methionine-rich copper-binding protein CopC